MGRLVVYKLVQRRDRQLRNNFFSKIEQKNEYLDEKYFDFSKLLLGKSERFEDFGAPRAFPAVALLVAWIVVGLCIIRGVKSSGKVCYFFLKILYILDFI
jgi:solute carrier family 6 amino acid transporter-like protein 5/7/9/14